MRRRPRPRAYGWCHPEGAAPRREPGDNGAMTVATVPVEVVAWVTKFVGGNGSQRRVFDEPVGPEATVRSVLRGLSARFPELHHALWTDGEIGPHVEVL